jgi:hypothetical protein
MFVIISYENCRKEVLIKVEGIATTQEKAEQFITENFEKLFIVDNPIEKYDIYDVVGKEIVKKNGKEIKPKYVYNKIDLYLDISNEKRILKLIKEKKDENGEKGYWNNLICGIVDVSD